MKFSIPTLALALTGSVSALTPAEWRSQSIYQVVTDRFARTDGSTDAPCDLDEQPYCGGTWQGIINKLDYIQGMGFTAIWISPVTQQIEDITAYGTSFHGYWQKNIYEVNSHFGTSDDLKALSTALHSRGMYLMVDVVTNHMASIGRNTDVDYSSFTPFNDPSYYHPFCYIDYQNISSIRNCWLGSDDVSLPDLRTDTVAVQDIWKGWIKDLVANYSIDGLRLDAAGQVGDFLAPFQEAAGGIHIIGEVYNPDIPYVCGYQNELSGVMNFPAYYSIINAFSSTKGSIVNLAKSVYKIRNSCKDVTLLGSFIENHDIVRFARRNKDMSLVKNAISYNILQDGIPITYYGQEQHYAGTGEGYNREALWHSGYNTESELYKFIRSINTIRNLAAAQDSGYVTYNAQPTQFDKSTVVMRKGTLGSHIIGVFSNLGSEAADYVLPVTYDNHFYGRNANLMEIVECVPYKTDQNALLSVNMSRGLPRVFYPLHKLEGTGICGASVAVKEKRISRHLAAHAHSF